MSAVEEVKAAQSALFLVAISGRPASDVFPVWGWVFRETRLAMRYARRCLRHECELMRESASALLGLTAACLWEVVAELVREKS